VCAPLFTIELGFLGANIVKIPHGGWFALTIGVILMVQMQTWRTGRALVAKRIQRGERPLQEVLDESNPERVPGTAFRRTNGPPSPVWSQACSRFSWSSASWRHPTCRRHLP
jgi:K+ transporter